MTLFARNLKKLALAACCGALSLQASAMVPIDLTMAGAVPKSSTTMQLRNVRVPGYGNYRINITWDPDQMIFRVQSVELDVLPQFALAQQPVALEGSLNKPDFNAICAQEFGGNYRMGAWEDVASAVGTSADNLASLANTLSLNPSSQIAVTYGGNVQEPSRKYMYMFSFDNDKPTARWGTLGVLSSSQSRLRLFYAAPHTSEFGRLLCTRTRATAPF